MSIIWRAVAEFAKKHSAEETDKLARKLLGLDEEVWRTTEEGHHIKIESATGEIKAGMGGKFNGQKIGTKFSESETKSVSSPKSAGKRIRPKSTEELVSSVAGSGNYMESRRYKDALSRWREAYKKRDPLTKELLKLNDDLEKEIQMEEGFDLGPAYADMFDMYTDKGKEIKKQRNNVREELKKAEEEESAASKALDRIKAEQHRKEVKDFVDGPLIETKKTDFDGFTIESDVPYIAETLESGRAKIVEMSPKEYLERCAFQIFNRSTLENTVNGTNTENVNKYADLMEGGEKFPIPYLNFSSGNQEGRHRALAAMMNGYETMPVAIIGKEVQAASEMREEPVSYNPDPDPAEIESLKKQISGLSRFGEQGKLRKELSAKLESMTAKPEKPKQSKRPDRPYISREGTGDPGHPVTPHKERQFEIVNAANPMHDDIHTGIRKPSDIMSPEEAFSNPEDYVYPDFTPEDGKKALESGVITLYSSYPIENGVFVSPSKMMASDYAGDGQVYSKTVPVGDVAWINAGEGQFAQVSDETQAMQEPETSYDPEDPNFDIFEWLTNGGGEEESPEEAEARRQKEAEQEREQKQREDYGQNGLAEREYPENLRLTDQERRAIFDVFRSYKDNSHKTDASRDVMEALSGLMTPELLEKRERQYREDLADAEEMIEKRKQEGYKFGDTPAGQAGLERKRQWWAFYNEHGYAPEALVGENGIRHWQTQRKKANENLKWMELAKKIAQRDVFARGQEGYMPWRKNDRRDDPSYKPWESHDSALALDEEMWRTTEEGKHFKFESSTGEIKAGFGGKFNGMKLGSSWKDGGSQVGPPKPPEKPKEPPKPKSPLDGWMDRLTPEEKERVDLRLGFGDRTVEEVLNRHFSPSNKKELLGIIASKTDWADRVLERNFEGLNEQESKDINYLLDQFPWGEDPKYAKIANEDALFDSVSADVNHYFLALKAKALGIEDVTVPERPKELEYAMTHKATAETINAQDSGYVHTEAGNKHRETIKSKILSGAMDNKFFRGLSEDTKHYADAVLESVDSMDDSMAELVAKTMDKADVVWYSEHDTSHYLSGRIAIFMRDINGEPRSDYDIARCFWHEYGHFVDDETFSEAGFVHHDNPLAEGSAYGHTGVTGSLMGKQRKMYHDAAKKDVEAILDFAGLSDRFGVKEFDEENAKLTLFRKSDGEEVRYRSEMDDMAADICDLQNGVSRALENHLGYDSLLNFMQERGAPQEVKYSDYVETYTTPKRHLVRQRERFPGAKEAYIEAAKERDKKWDEWVESIGGQDAYFELAHERDRAWEAFREKKKKLGGITDCLDEATNGMFCMVVAWGGHDEAYYRQKVVPLETTANIFSARARNDADEVSFMNKVIPNLSRLYTQAWRARYE